MMNSFYSYFSFYLNVLLKLLILQGFFILFFQLLQILHYSSSSHKEDQSFFHFLLQLLYCFIFWLHSFSIANPISFMLAYHQHFPCYLSEISKASIFYSVRLGRPLLLITLQLLLSTLFFCFFHQQSFIFQQLFNLSAFKTPLLCSFILVLS